MVKLCAEYPSIDTIKVSFINIEWGHVKAHESSVLLAFISVLSACTGGNEQRTASIEHESTTLANE